MKKFPWKSPWQSNSQKITVIFCSYGFVPSCEWCLWYKQRTSLGINEMLFKTTVYVENYDIPDYKVNSYNAVLALIAAVLKASTGVCKGSLL